MTEKEQGTRAIEDALAQVREQRLPPGLMARVLDDAEAVAKARDAGARRRGSFGGHLAAALRDLGGWPSLAGLAAASVAGLAVGLSEPEAVLPSLSNAPGTAFEIVDLVPGYGIVDAWEE